MIVLVRYTDLDMGYFCLHYVCLYHSKYQHTNLSTAFYVSRLDTLSVLSVQCINAIIIILEQYSIVFHVKLIKIVIIVLKVVILKP